VYKFEALKLFRNFIMKVNEDLVSFILRATIYAEEQAAPQRQEPPRRPEPKPQLRESRSEMPEQEEASGNGQPAPRQQPVKADKIASRNDRVTVRYFNGDLKRDVKFKTVEEDILANRCVIVDM
jgi:preprotein translocase subunit SecA